MPSIVASEGPWFGRFIPSGRPAHISAKCAIFNARDQRNDGALVALKLMRNKHIFIRELEARRCGLEEENVVGLITTSPLITEEDPELSSWSDYIELDVDMETITRAEVEQFFCLVMPVGDRDLYAAMRHEKLGGVINFNEETVRGVMITLINCVYHMHSLGVLHGGLKPANILRVNGAWKLIDLESSCLLDTEFIFSDFNSAYYPPECVYIDRPNNLAFVRCESSLMRYKNVRDCQLLIAKASFDIWALGCVLYQLCNHGNRPLFTGFLDDELSADVADEDSLWSLAEWSEDFKEKKLQRVVDSYLVWHLLSQILQKDPLKRPSLIRILDHPFLSGKDVSRLSGDESFYDIFLSYRADCDTAHTERIRHQLESLGLSVWSRHLLPEGIDWVNGMAVGLSNCRVCVCIISEAAVFRGGAIDTENDAPSSLETAAGTVVTGVQQRSTCNFSQLTPESPIDDLILEYALALELKQAGLLETIFPVFLGAPMSVSDYPFFHVSSESNQLPDVVVDAIELCLNVDMQILALGEAVYLRQSVSTVVQRITEHRGAVVPLEEAGSGLSSEALDQVGIDVSALVRRTANKSSHGKRMPQQQDAIDQVLQTDLICASDVIDNTCVSSNISDRVLSHRMQANPIDVTIGTVITDEITAFPSDASAEAAVGAPTTLSIDKEGPLCSPVAVQEAVSSHWQDYSDQLNEQLELQKQSLLQSFEMRLKQERDRLREEFESQIEEKRSYSAATLAKCEEEKKLLEESCEELTLQLNRIKNGKGAEEANEVAISQQLALTHDLAEEKQKSDVLIAELSTIIVAKDLDIARLTMEAEIAKAELVTHQRQIVEATEAAPFESGIADAGLNRQNATDTNAIARLNELLGQEKAASATLGKEMARVQSQCSTLELALHTAESTIVELEKNRVGEEERIATQTKKQEDLTKEVMSLKKKISELEEELRAERKEITQMPISGASDTGSVDKSSKEKENVTGLGSMQLRNLELLPEYLGPGKSPRTLQAAMAVAAATSADYHDIKVGADVKAVKVTLPLSVQSESPTAAAHTSPKAASKVLYADPAAKALEDFKNLTLSHVSLALRTGGVLAPGGMTETTSSGKANLKILKIASHMDDIRNMRDALMKIQASPSAAASGSTMRAPRGNTARKPSISRLGG